MRKQGELVICERCGTTTFRALIEKESLDGGFTTRNVLEEYPKTWEITSGIGDLCPDCLAIYKNFLNDFLHNKESEVSK